MRLSEMMAPTNAALVLIDFQPAMLQWAKSHDRTVIVDSAQIFACTAKLFKVPTIIGIAAAWFSGPS